LSKRKLDKYLKNRDFAQLKKQGDSIAERLGIEIESETFNPVIVDFYQQIGYLPDALLNYLLLLGWSLDDCTEEFTREEMLKHFSLSRVNKAPASFDPLKLVAFQDRAMQQLPIKQKVAKVLPFLQQSGYIADPPTCDTAPKLTKILEGAGDRVKVAGDILDYTDFYTADDALSYDEKAFEKRLRKPADAQPLLAAFREQLAAIEVFEPVELEACLKDFVVAQEIKIGQIIHALRVAVTGKAVGFGVFETLAILGQASCLARIDRALSLLS